MKTYKIERRPFFKVLVTNLENGNLIEVSADIDSSIPAIEDYKFRLLTSRDDNRAYWLSGKNEGFGSVYHYINSEAIQEAKQNIAKQLEERKEIVKAFLKTDLGIEMEYIFESHAKYYKSDFYFHDARNIPDLVNKKFIWIVRECGSWLLIQDNEFSDEILNAKDSTKRFFVYDGNLTEVSNSEAIQFAKEKLPSESRRKAFLKSFMVE